MNLEFNNSLARKWSRIGPRGIYGQSLLSLAGHNENLFAISADLGNSSGLDRFSQTYKDRFLNIGIAEQNMIGFASGLSTLDFNVFVSSFAPFITMRAGEQVRMNLSYMQSNVKIVAIGSGISMGYLGNSHFGLEDISIIRSLPSMPIICPSDCFEVYKCTEALSYHSGPAFVRLTGAAPSPIINTTDYEFKIGSALKLNDGDDLLILTHGSMVYYSLQAVKQLKDKYNIKASLFNVHTLHPLDILITDVLSNFKHVFTIEEHSIVGGLGTIISEIISENSSSSTNLTRIGLPTTFLKSGTYEQLLAKYKLDSNGIIEQILHKLNIHADP